MWTRATRLSLLYHLGRSQYTLWKRCLSLVGDGFDLIVKARPDIFSMPEVTSLGWHTRCARTGQPMLSLLGQNLLVTNTSVFAFISPYDDEGIDDTFIIGAAAVMRVAVGVLKDRTASGAYDPWLHSSAERLFHQHLKANNISIHCMGGRGLFTKFDSCSRCLLPNGTGFRFGTTARMPSPWTSADIAGSARGVRAWADERGASSPRLASGQVSAAGM